MKKVVRKILQGCSLTAAMFVFQACYGTEPDMGELVRFSFQLVDENDNAIEGIKLQSRWEHPNSHGSWELQGVSESNGVVQAQIYDREFPFTTFQFSDEQSRFEVIDTTFSSLPEVDTVKILLKRTANEQD